MKSRLAKLRKKLAENGIDALLVCQAQNRRYLSGFRSSDGYLLITQSKIVIALDSRYVESAKKSLDKSLAIEVYKTQGELSRWLPDLLSCININNLGFEDSFVSFSFYRAVSESLNSLNRTIELVPIGKLIASLRVVKDEAELTLLSKAAAIVDTAFGHLKSKMQPGMTEKQVAWLLESLIRENGSSAVPFGIIVASGTNAAYPHFSATDRTIKVGEPITMDFGARVDGYCSDITRTVCLGAPDSKLGEIYNIVLDSQMKAINEIKSGMTGEQADKIARNVINEAGYGQYFGHGLGHGIGVDVHEEPRLSENSTDILTDGMIFSIEPGIYIPGWGGVRIEDMVVLSNGKVNTLTKASKGLS
ncbi:M24 family metallopeptidase [Chloroflexota bacterium]